MSALVCSWKPRLGWSEGHCFATRCQLPIGRLQFHPETTFAVGWVDGLSETAGGGAIRRCEAECLKTAAQRVQPFKTAGRTAASLPEAEVMNAANRARAKEVAPCTLTRRCPALG